MAVTSPALILNELNAAPAPDTIATILLSWFARSIVADPYADEQLYTKGFLNLLALNSTPTPDTIAVIQDSWARRSIALRGLLSGDFTGKGVSSEPAFLADVMVI